MAWRLARRAKTLKLFANIASKASLQDHLGAVATFHIMQQFIDSLNLVVSPLSRLVDRILGGRSVPRDVYLTWAGAADCHIGSRGVIMS
ncbi:hypothetical protein BR93DRAFT_181423 [Coniochaeta sp. PMI_546]|nr:hypothetical protein BR93DRAFT_181423 [Coniochaeta sp. PMI_546]